jgi:formylglycine-generating enzyme required for sulfatase activity
MTYFPSGVFTPGSTHGYPEERPGGPARVGAFWIDRTEVTNAQFAIFIAETRYRTVAEQIGAAAVFVVPRAAEEGIKNAWWRRIVGANWRHPEGSGSNLTHRGNHPVIHVALADAQAYARWLGRDLPTEAEWEYAARDGAVGDQRDTEPRDARGPSANYWQGSFPDGNTFEDGFLGTAPVGCFSPSVSGLYDMIGNVWEWTNDTYGNWSEQAAITIAPIGACHAAGASRNAYVIKGGSYLCASSYCARFRAAARHPQEPDVPTSHIGFRTVLRP